MIVKFDISSFNVITALDLHDGAFFEDLFPMKTGLPQQFASKSLPSTSSSIPIQVDRMKNVKVNEVEEDKPRIGGLEFLNILKWLHHLQYEGWPFSKKYIKDDPATFKDAMDSSEAMHLKDAIKSKINLVLSNGTWELVNLPQSSTALGCKWIFKKKIKLHETVGKYKARLVMKDYK